MSPDEDCGGSLNFMKLADHYSSWRLEEMLLECIKCYRSRKKVDDEIEENIRVIIYWVNQRSFNRRYVNKRLKVA